LIQDTLSFSHIFPQESRSLSVLVSCPGLDFTTQWLTWVSHSILFLQMIFGLSVIQKYASPMSLAESLTLSESLNEFVHKLFKADPKKRPRAFELSSSEFLATDAPILDEDSSAAASRFGSITSLMPVTPRRQRHDSMNSGKCKPSLPNSSQYQARKFFRTPFYHVMSFFHYLLHRVPTNLLIS